MSTKRRLILTVLLFAVPVLAQFDYFPLQIGNQWIYRSSDGDIMQLEVTRSTEFRGQRYYLLQGLPGGDYWIRRDENGSVVAYDPDRALEQLWYGFLNPVGQPYPTLVPGSNNSPAVVNSTKALYWGPIGWFDWALEIQYPGTFQVGLYKELFLPYVGLVHREQGAGGPRMITWDLIYMRSGGVTYVTEQSVTFSLTLDRYSYQTQTEMIARFTLRNHRWQDLQLPFSTSQIYDFVLRNEKGEIVYRWSDGKAFLQALCTETYGFGEKNYALLVSLANGSGKPLPAGKYTAEAWLTASLPQSYGATVGFEIVSP